MFRATVPFPGRKNASFINQLPSSGREKCRF